MRPAVAAVINPMMLFGTLSTGFGTVLGYFFGTSKSSGDKDKIIANGAGKGIIS